MITGIVVALKDEISTLTSQKIDKGDCYFINDKTLVAFAGAGSKNATIASRLLIDKGAERLISWGCAAGLKANLHPGDLVIPDVLQTEEREQLSLSSPWLHYVIDELSSLNPYTGVLAESSTAVTSSNDKKTVHRQTRGIALDMESFAIAQIAKHNNLPVLVIRTIVDPLSMDLPKAVSYALTAEGDVVIIKLLGYLLTHPTELPGLIKLGFHFNAAKNKLKLVATHLDTIVGFEQ